MLTIASTPVLRAARSSDLIVQGIEDQGFVAALRFGALTRYYDPVVAATTRERTFRSRLLRQASVQPGQRVLDLGCGTGTFAIAVKQRQPDAEVFGVDGDPDVLDRARRKARSAKVAVAFDLGRAEQLPYEDGVFDVVTSSLFFHHLDRLVKERASSEVARVLRPGGELHVADWGPPGDPLMALASLAIRLLDGFSPTRDNVAGRLPLIFSHGGLVDVRDRGRLRTMVGTMAFVSARRPQIAAAGSRAASALDAAPGGHVDAKDQLDLHRPRGRRRRHAGAVRGWLRRRPAWRRRRGEREGGAGC